MGLLPIDTVSREKRRETRVTGSFEGLSGVLKSLNGVAIEGYEIHMGATTRKEGCQASTKICNHAAAGTAEESWTEPAMTTFMALRSRRFDKEAW